MDLQLSEVRKYIEKYKNDLIVIKYGGNVFIDRNIFNNFISDLSILNKIRSFNCCCSWRWAKN